MYRGEGDGINSSDATQLVRVVLDRQDELGVCHSLLDLSHNLKDNAATVVE